MEIRGLREVASPFFVDMREALSIWAHQKVRVGTLPYISREIFRLRYAVLLLLFVLVGAEFIARTWLGLGTPPIFVRHPTTEYMHKPNQDVMRFGTRQLYNELGMRNFSTAQFGKREVIMVFGDSVVNGGALTDHENLATSILTNERVVYANISAGSWGPQNMAAYWAEFREKLPYRKAILVLSSHDYTDIPTFAPLDPRTHPTETPALALLEGAFSYLPRYLPDSWFNDPSKSAERFRNEADRAQPGEQAIHKLIDQFRRDGVSLCVVRHYTLSEMGNVPETGDALMAMAIAKHSLPLVDLRKHYPPNVPRKTFFRDDIHFNASGQTILAKAVARCASFLD